VGHNLIMQFSRSFVLMYICANNVMRYTYPYHKLKTRDRWR
jgi:hypothetical protein